MSPTQIVVVFCLLGAAHARPEKLHSVGHPHPSPHGSYVAPQPSYTPPQPAYTPPQPTYTPPQPSYSKPEPSHPPQPHTFDYAVKDYEGNDFGHSENSDGKVVSGTYYVHLPDGRLQRVSYTADHYGGYIADVQYEGEAQYPAHQPAQTYHAPAPAHPPAQTYHAPAPAHPPAQTYHAPAPTHPPAQTYHAPAHPPAQSYLAPVPAHPAPKPSYSAPHF